MNTPEQVSFDASAAIKTLGIESAALDAVWQRLDQNRNEVLGADVQLFESAGEVPEAKQPLDSGFIRWPDRLLEEYDDHATRSASLVNRILEAARQLAGQVDRVVVLGIGGSYMGAKALMDACCEPYFNELPRDRRGGRPRIYFAGNNVDNDRTSGLIDLLKSDGKPWGIVVISKSGGTMETAVSFRQFFRALADTVGDSGELAQLVIPVTGQGGKLDKLAREIGCVNQFEVPDGIGGRFSILTPVGLLPAAVMGLDIVSLLRGAWMMNSIFENGSPGNNPVMDYVALNCLAEEAGFDIRVLSVWSDALECMGFWYDQLLSESLGKTQKSAAGEESTFGATPITALNTRDLHSRAQQHQEGKFNKLFNNVKLKSYRCDQQQVGGLPWNHDELDQYSSLALPDLMDAAFAGTNQALADDRKPTADLFLPKADEISLGQFFQMMMLATVLEGRFLGINPYGQPGVEKYKRNMKTILNSKIGAGA